MSYCTLMVHFELYQTNAEVLHIARDLADRFGSRLIGVAVGLPMMADYPKEFVIPAISGTRIELDQEHIEAEMLKLQTVFKTELGSLGSKAEWRSLITYGSALAGLSNEARCADLIVICPRRDKSLGTGGINVGDLVFQAGRPVLVVPPEAKQLPLRRAIICWKDTREARRSISDALELLKLYQDIEIIEINRDMEASESHLSDVAKWLRSHGVSADPVSIASEGDDDTAQLTAAIRFRDPDLIVAGAYGHCRFREMIFGGVTHDLLAHPDRCSFLSH